MRSVLPSGEKSGPKAERPNPLKVINSLPLATFQIFALVGSPEASVRLSWLKAAWSSPLPVCISDRTLRSWPLGTSQIRISFSLPSEANKAPFGENMQERMSW